MDITSVVSRARPSTREGFTTTTPSPPNNMSSHKAHVDEGLCDVGGIHHTAIITYPSRASLTEDLPDLRYQALVHDNVSHVTTIAATLYPLPSASNSTGESSHLYGRMRTPQESGEVSVIPRRTTTRVHSGHELVSPTLHKELAQLSSMLSLFLNTNDPLSTMRALAGEAIRYCSVLHTQKDAITWGDNFTFPPEVYERDMALYTTSRLSIPNMVRSIQDEQRIHRFSTKRVIEVIPSTYEGYTKLLSLAEGMHVYTPPSYKSSPLPPPIRQLYSTLSSCVNKLVFKEWEAQRLFILPTDSIVDLGVHYSPFHWTVNKGKPSGRCLVDYSDNSNGDALNGPEALEWGHTHIGKIIHPSLTTIVRTFYSFASTYLSDHRDKTWADLTFWKCDLKGAFTLISYHPDSAVLLCSLLTGGLTAIYHCGNFGGTNTPVHFDLITKALVYTVSPLLHGCLEAYVDDFFGICPILSLQHDRGIFIDTAVRLLGPNAVALEKNEDGPQLDILGFNYNLITQHISVGQHSFLRFVYVFYLLNTEAKIELQEAQRLASLSQRYQAVCPVMAPFTTAFHMMTRRFGKKHSAHSLTWTAKCGVWMWRALMAAMSFDPNNHSRSWLSFLPLPQPNIQIQFDACLFGLGGIISTINPNGTVTERGVYQHPIPFAFGTDSSYQNISEFIAIMVGLILVIQHLPQPRTAILVHLVGDSKSALAWAASGTVKSEQHNHLLSCVFALLKHQYNICITSTTWIDSKSNDICDTLSRFGDMAVYPQCYSADKYKLVISPTVLTMLQVCDPIVDRGDMTANTFHTLWLQLSLLLRDCTINHVTFPLPSTMPTHPCIITNSHTFICTHS